MNGVNEKMKYLLLIVPSTIAVLILHKYDEYLNSPVNINEFTCVGWPPRFAVLLDSHLEARINLEQKNKQILTAGRLILQDMTVPPEYYPLKIALVSKKSLFRIVYVI
jgi:hypothetical protein